MGTSLHDLRSAPGATRNKKRIGRGQGSGTGQNAGKGTKGQKKRTGHHGARVGFEGGQMPMQRRIPKRGFKNFFRTEYFAVNVSSLSDKFDEGSVVDVDAMKSAGIVPRKAPLVKVLGQGDVGKKLTVRAHAFSESAKTKLADKGGSAEVIKQGGSARSTKKPSAEAPTA